MSAVEETLAWEAEQRPRAAAAALLGGAGTIVGSLLFLAALNDYPSEDDGFISVTEGLSARLAGAPPQEPSLLAAQLTERHDQAPALWASAILLALGTALAMLALLYVYRATKARAEETSRVAYFAATIALVLYPVGHLISEGAVLLADDAQTAEEARDVFGGGAVLLGETLEFFGTFSVGLAFVLVALNAMRVGLLTRFMGILGIVVGVMAVIQLDPPQLIRSVWLVLLAALIAGRIRDRPPAWDTGRAQPWPTRQQLYEARQAAAGVQPAPPAEPAEDAPPDAPVPIKRKRKKRR